MAPGENWSREHILAFNLTHKFPSVPFTLEIPTYRNLLNCLAEASGLFRENLRISRGSIRSFSNLASEDLNTALTVKKRFRMNLQAP
jgi:hypothetical protein